MTCIGEREIQSVSGRLLDNLGEMAQMMYMTQVAHQAGANVSVSCSMKYLGAFLPPSPPSKMLQL